MIDDWNPDDPDTVKVVYDLSSWNFDQQADVAADLAEAGIPHVWDGTDLMVPQEIEARADAVIDALEQRFGITYDDSNDGSDGDDLPSTPTATRIDLTDGEACTEYDLADWSALDRTTLTVPTSCRSRCSPRSSSPPIDFAATRSTPTASNRWSRRVR